MRLEVLSRELFEVRKIIAEVTREARQEMESGQDPTLLRGKLAWHRLRCANMRKELAALQAAERAAAAIKVEAW